MGERLKKGWGQAGPTLSTSPGSPGPPVASPPTAGLRIIEVYVKYQRGVEKPAWTCVGLSPAQPNLELALREGKVEQSFKKTSEKEPG